MSSIAASSLWAAIALIRSRRVADAAWIAPPHGLFAPEGVVVEDQQGLLERLERRDVVVGHAGGGGERHFVSAQQVTSAQVDRVSSHLAGGDVEQDLAGERFELPGTAIGG